MRRAAALLLLLAAALPARAWAQEDCEFLAGTGNVRGVTLGASRITYLSTPNLACKNGVRIRADSAVVFESSDFTQLFGHVRFEDAERRLRSQRAQYFSKVGRLQAQDDVELTRKADGSVVRGQELVYLPEAEGRPERLTVTGGRPTATLRLEPTAAAGPDSAASAPGSAVTYQVEADRIVLEGATGFVATSRRGPVSILRDSLQAYADSVSYAPDAGVLALRQKARLNSASYDLSADSIDVVLPDQQVREIRAEHDAVLAGEDVHLMAPRIHLFLQDGLLQRLVARGEPPAAQDSAAAPPEPGHPRPLRRSAPGPRPSRSSSWPTRWTSWRRGRCSSGWWRWATPGACPAPGIR